MGEIMLHRRIAVATVMLLIAVTHAASPQGAPASPDSAQSQIRSVLRAFYFHLENHNWEALSAYVLSPKLLERRGAPEDSLLVTRDRLRGKGSANTASMPQTCPAKPQASVDRAAIRLDGDWAEVSVPRCSGNLAGVDELRLLYFEQRWRFIYTDLFDSTSQGGR
jgi:hypothetical protein